MNRRDEALLKAVLAAYPDRLAVRRDDDPTRATMVGGRAATLEPASVVRRSRLFVCVDARDVEGPRGVETRVAVASAVREEWLAEMFPNLVGRREIARFDPERGKVIVRVEKTFLDLPFRSSESGAVDPAVAGDALFAWIRDESRGGVAGFVAGDDGAARLAARVDFLAREAPDFGLPRADAPFLERAVEAACRRENSLDRAAKNLRAAIRGLLPGAAARTLDREAPETIAVPSGSAVRLEYPPDGAPVLAVRLQELFGMAKTPRVAAGRVPVVLQLLGPNFRPVQTTRDLESFWRTTYAEVRRELRARYPKHPWPEDPTTATPRAVGGRGRRGP